MFTDIKRSVFTAGATSLLSLGTLSVASPSYALTFDFSTWQGTGDYSTTSNQAIINSGTINTVDAGGGTGSLENFLGIGSSDIVNTIPNAVYGSAIRTTSVPVNAGDVFSFNWNFSTGDSDQGFVTINNTVTALSGSSPFSYTFSTAGNYNLGIGVVDVDDSLGTSTLTVSNASQGVPEPSDILGLFIQLGFGIAMIWRFRKKASV